jgi:serine/threonine-protein kinase RsbW
LAVDEAVSLLIGDAVPGTTLRCSWVPTDTGVKIKITSVSSARRPPRSTTFAWTVLAALVDKAEAEYVDPEVTVSLTTARSWPDTESVA